MEARVSNPVRSRPRATKRQGRLDWDEWRARIAKVVQAQSNAQLSAEQSTQLLIERAHSLAIAAEESPGAISEVAVFAVGAERYGIETRFVKQTLLRSSITPVPGTPEILIGVIIVQGEIVPLFDARRVLHLTPDQKAVAEASWILVLGEQGPDLALLVDRTSEVARIAIAELITSPLPMSRSRLHRGVMRDGLLVLDGGELLRDPRLVIGGASEVE